MEQTKVSYSELFPVDTKINFDFDDQDIKKILDVEVEPCAAFREGTSSTIIYDCNAGEDVWCVYLRVEEKDGEHSNRDLADFFYRDQAEKFAAFIEKILNIKQKTKHNANKEASKKRKRAK